MNHLLSVSLRPNLRSLPLSFNETPFDVLSYPPPFLSLLPRLVEGPPHPQRGPDLDQAPPR